MKKIFIALALTVGASSAHASLLSIENAKDITFTGYNGQPAEQTGLFSTGQTGTLVALDTGIFSVTYLGAESAYDNVFNLGINGAQLTEQSLLGTTISAQVNAGLIDFSFADDMGGSAANEASSVSTSSSEFDFLAWLLRKIKGKDSPEQQASFAILDNGNGNCTANFGCFEYFLGFNDSFKDDKDFDDFVVGINMTSIPAPVPLPAAGWLFGSAVLSLGAMARRRKLRLSSENSEV